jgi:hypothetical protein
VEDVPNPLYLGSSQRSVIVEEEEYEKYAVHGTLAHAYYRPDEDFPRAVSVEPSSEESDGSLFGGDEEVTGED